MATFLGFVRAAGLNVDPGSPLNAKPPQPDIACTVDGAQYFFELGEITDEGLAKDVNTSLLTGVDSEGGFFSEEIPLIRIIRKKLASRYQTNGVPLDLVLHYDKQSAFAPATYLTRYESDISGALVPNGPFLRIWIYDSWTKSILWKRP
jgi:hypothetical protein